MDPKLSKAAEEGDVMYLASRIARINRTEEEEKRYGRCEGRCLLNTTEEGRNNILHLAAKAGHDLFVALALQFLPALSNQLNSQGETPLLVAAKFGHLNVAGAIKKPKIKFEMRPGTAAGTTTLIGAYSSGRSRHGEEGLVDIDLELGTKAIEYLSICCQQIDAEERIGMNRMDPELYEAAKRGDGSCLSGIDGRDITEEEAKGIQDGKFLKRTQYGNNSILHIAARAGHKTFVVEALKRFHFLSVKGNREGDTPLIVAARFGHLEVVKALAEPDNYEAQMQDDRATGRENGTNSRSSRRPADIEEGPSVDQLEQGTVLDNVPTEENETNSSIHQREEEEVPIDNQLEHATAVEDATQSSSRQRDEGEGRVEHQSYMLIPRPWRLRNLKEDTTALHEALRNGHRSVARYLFGLDPEMVTLVNGAEESPLYLAAESGCQIFMTDVLLSEQPYSTEGPQGQNALQAARDCDGTIITELIEQNPDLMRKLDNHGKAAIHFAVEAYYWNFIDRMMEADALIALFPDAEGYTLFLRAAQSGFFETCLYILKLCPESIEARNSEGQHALHLANFSYIVGSRFGEIPEIMELLNVSDDKGNTPLHLAVKENHYEKVMLLSSLANINLGAVNKEGHTALDLCESDWKHYTKKTLMWLLLRRHGAPRGRRPNEHKVPLFFNRGWVDPDADLTPFNSTIILVATLLASVTFTAAFTIPCAFDQNSGTAILGKKAALQLFIVSDTLAMCCSLSVVFLLAGTMLGGQDVAWIWGILSWNLLSITLLATLVAFMSGIFAVICSKALWLAIFVCVVCSLAPFMISSCSSYGSAIWPRGWPTILNADFRRRRQSKKRMKIRKSEHHNARLIMQRGYPNSTNRRNDSIAAS